MTEEKETIIKVEGVSKLYRLGVKEKVHDNLSGTIADILLTPIRNYRKYRSLYNFKDVTESNKHNSVNKDSDVIWALQDVSFEVQQGEVLGIIGRNGAGKSTLLKILTQITPPTQGKITLHGRVASLLEVGTGFHQELTGRENVYLNGTILGMKKREVDRKFDEIVDFSGVERFLDTPVKRYSSGMRVRLAFAVAAHLEPEILIIDEVLAVGDAAFQRKCLDKMEDVGKHGRTVLFVSHNMPAVTRLCERVILLDDGCLVADGPSQKTVSAYLDSGQGTTALREWPAEKAPGRDVAHLRAVRVIDRKGTLVDAIDIREEVGLQMEYEVKKPDQVLLPLFYVFNDEGVNVFGTLDQDVAWRGRPRPEGRYFSTAWIPGNFLSEGTFFINCSLMTLNPNINQFWERQAVAFHVIDRMDGSTARGVWSGEIGGVVRPILEWTTVYHPC
jgi:lipopolysaccharide transport system ATP-binding protein